jgi:hypothetical protein
MRQRTFLVGSLFAGIFVGSNGCAPPAPETVRADPAPEPDTKPPHPAAVGSLGGFGGKVTKIGPDWFEIGAGWDGEPDILKKKHNEGNDKPVQVFVGGTRVAGDRDGLGHPGVDTYRFADLKIGDVVSIHTAITPKGQQYAVEVIIRRRPGGKIPLLPADQFGVANFTSARNQAEQDWEEQGIAIPKKYLDKDGRYPWTNPPYPPVAPAPREAKAKPTP